MVSPRRRAPMLPNYPRLRVGVESEDRFRIQEHQACCGEDTKPPGSGPRSRNRELTGRAHPRHDLLAVMFALIHDPPVVTIEPSLISPSGGFFASMKEAAN